MPFGMAARTLLAVAALALAGCGFRPLYGSGPAAPAEDRLAAVAVLPIADRSGQVLRNHLLDLLTPQGPPARPDFVLDVRLRERIDRLGVQKTELATRANLWLEAIYGLSAPGRDNPVFRGESVAIASFNILGVEDLATLIAEKDARERALRQLAEDIRTRLAAHFVQAGAAPPRAAR